MQVNELTTDGYYVIEYTGIAGKGIGQMILDGGEVVGSDFVGGALEGTYKYNPKTDCFDLELNFTVPIGAWLVMGVPPSKAEYSFPINTSLPRDFAGEHPVNIETPYGPVIVEIRKLRDFPA